LTTKIKWLGHASFEIITNKGSIIYLDPWINGNPVCPIKLEEIEKADIVCVTHGHPDHLGDGIEIAKKTKAKFICSPEIGKYAEMAGIPYDKENSIPLNIGGSAEINGISITMVPAVHSSDTWIEGKMYPGSGACGYVIKTEDNVRIYFAGDTGLFGDMRLIGEVYAPHIAILPVGGKYNMGIREAAIASSFLSPEIVIPMHYGTYPNQMANIDEFIKLVNTLAPKTKVLVPKCGEYIEY